MCTNTRRPALHHTDDIIVLDLDLRPRSFPFASFLSIIRNRSLDNGRSTVCHFDPGSLINLRMRSGEKFCRRNFSLSLNLLHRAPVVYCYHYYVSPVLIRWSVNVQLEGLVQLSVSQLLPTSKAGLFVRSLSSASFSSSLIFAATFQAPPERIEALVPASGATSRDNVERSIGDGFDPG